MVVATMTGATAPVDPVMVMESAPGMTDAEACPADMQKRTAVYGGATLNVSACVGFGLPATPE